MKNILMIGLVLTLAGCGGVYQFKKKNRAANRITQPIAITPNTTPAPVNVTPRATPVVAPRRTKPFATGPIGSACQASDRKARSRALCGCIQAVADQSLSNTQQRRAVAFYSDPNRAQEIRQSERPGDKQFWKAYSNYAERAKATCK